MTVARRLQSAFIAFVVLIAALVVFQVRTIRAAADSGHALADISSRFRITSNDQLARVGQMSDDAEKFLVTRDSAYLARADESARVFGRELARLNSLELTRGERSALVRLATEWRTVAPMTDALLQLPGLPPAVAQAAVERFQAALVPVANETRELGAASQAAMADELAAVERSASSTLRISVLAAIGALVLMILLSAHLLRSIIGPLHRLADGTRQVSAGRFDYRLDTSGDEELAQVARDFNSMTGRLDELDRLKKEFVAKVSHDLKTPLSSMQETTSALLDGVAGPLSEKQRHLLALNLESSQRLSAMLSKLLDLSHLEAGLEPRRQPVDVKQLVFASVERLAASPVRVAVIAQGDLPTVDADAQALGQVVDNLLENAIKFSPPDGKVTIQAIDWSSARTSIPPERAAAFRWRGPQQSAVLLTVRDQGPGIPDAEKERVFARFYQTEAGRAVRGRGVGLGLAICREIVNAHGGMIWASDNEPRGTVFSVLLPSADTARGTVEPIAAVAGASVP